MVVATAVACSNGKPKDEPIVSDIFVEQKVGDFIAQNPDWATGEKVSDATVDKFKHEVIRWSNEQEFLNQMPLQLKGLRDTLLNDQSFKIATFTGYNDTNRKIGSLLNYIQLQIDGIVPNDLLKELKPNQNYTLTGLLYKQGKRADVKLIKVADFKGYDLGKYTFSVTAVKPVK